MDSFKPISSAVIIPSDPIQSPPPPKRRQSLSLDTASKRPRLSDGSAESPYTALASPQSDSKRRGSITQEQQDNHKHNDLQARRRSSVQEEKKRGQRLFGGLLSTLSQSTPTGQQKRRQDIEKRQAEKAEQQKLADEVRKAEKLAKLNKIRVAEQIKFAEESMRIRHTNLLAMANFLCTKTEPKLYYKPWELMPTDEKRLEAQLAEAATLVEHEAEEFYEQHPTRKPDSLASKGKGTKINDTFNETVGEPQSESPSASKVQTDTTNKTVQGSSSEQERVAIEKEGVEEHNGEDVVVAEEDTVIY